MSAYNRNPKEPVSLDEIRNSRGIDVMRESFRDLTDNNLERALYLINNKNLKYSTLFILQQDIQNANIVPNLNQRNKNALEITNGILLKEFIGTHRFSAGARQEDATTLKWMLDTGYIDDGLNDEYDEVIDTTAIILAKIYKDRGCLNTIEDLIFKRNRKGAFIYDLVWAYFEVINPEDLVLVANRLRSNNKMDVELARNFLNFIPYIGTNREGNPLKQYNYSLRWIGKNVKYLYYTGETNLQTFNPYRYRVSMEAKYLQRTAAELFSSDGTRSLTEEENNSLNYFKNLDDDTKQKLSDCSAVLYQKNRYRWSKWIQSPVDKQIETADRILEGS